MENVINLEPVTDKAMLLESVNDAIAVLLNNVEAVPTDEIARIAEPLLTMRTIIKNTPRMTTDEPKF